MPNPNPERIKSLSPGLLAQSYPGWATDWSLNPEWLASCVSAGLRDGNYLGSAASLEQWVEASAPPPITTGIKNSGDGTVTVFFSGTPYVQYVAQASSNLAAPLWTMALTKIGPPALT